MPNPQAHRELMLEVLGQFRILLRSIREHYRRIEARSSLGGAQLWALAEIAAGRGMSVGDLARRLAIHLSTASNLAGRLDRLGMVTRQRAGGDQRKMTLVVTPKGRRALKAAPQPLVGVLQKALLDHPPARLEALRRELGAVLRRVRPRETGAAHDSLAEILSERKSRRAGPRR